MKTLSHNDETIGQYLLGALSDEETERLDELSIVDDEFAARLTAVENDLVDSYVRGELTGQTLERFNSFYLSSPRRREKVEFSKTFRGVAERTVLAAEPTREVSNGEKRATGARGPWRFFFPRPVLMWGAACAALLILAVGLVLVNQRLRDQVSTIQAQREALEQRDRELREQLDRERSSVSVQEKEIEGLRDKVAQLEQIGPQPGNLPVLSDKPYIEAFDLSPQTRGIGQIATLNVPADADYVTLNLTLEAGDYPSYRTDLESLPDRRVVWRSGRVRARTRGDQRIIAVSLRARVMKPQIYLLEVVGISPSGAREPAGSYSFRVVKE